jgi:hypothetical protein
MRRENDDQIIENVETFLRTFHHQGKYDVEFDNALSSDRQRFLPDRPNQASYDKPDNWVERNRIGLEKVKKRLQDCITSAMQDSSFNLELRHNDGWDHLRDNEEPIVWHEPILDRYWDQLETKIGGNKLGGVTTDIKFIAIENIEIRKDSLAALVAMFLSGRATNSSTRLNFVNASICGAGIVCLSKLVDVSSNLREFCLHRNRIDNSESAHCLSRSLKSHTRIYYLGFTHCDLGSTPEVLLVLLQSDVRRINLSNNNIDSLGAVKIAEYLEGDPPIEELILEYNQLNDDDAILISQALKRNTNLKTLRIHSNNFTFIGVKALISCVVDSSSLNAILESNHTLTEMGIFSCINHPIKRLDRCIYKLLGLDRKAKIVLALQDKDSLLKYLANVPVELIPEVLAFALRPADDPYQWVVDQPQHKHLNIVYCTMRWWNMPMLYLYHQSCVNSDIKRKMDV